MFIRRGINKFSRNLLTTEVINNNSVRIPVAAHLATAGKLVTENTKSNEKFPNFYQKLSSAEIGELISDKFTETPEFNQWEEFRKEIFDMKTNINEKTIDATIMGYLSMEKNLKFAKSYMSFLEKSNRAPNLATTGKFLRTCYNYFEGKQVPDEDQENILKWSQKLLKLGILDATTAENVILGLVLTKQWEESLKVLDMIKLSDAKPASAVYSVIVAASFDNGKSEIGWKLLDEMLEANRPPRCITYKSWIRQCLTRFEKHKDTTKLLTSLEKMLNFIGDNDLQISKTVAEDLIEAFKILKWRGQFSVSNKGCKCGSCDTTFQPIILNETDFMNLQKEFLSKVLIRKNVFARSTPKELENFKYFLVKTSPYDIVIDGLNVAYCSGKKNPADLGNAVSSAVRYFLDRKKKVLVLGRKHMANWPQMKFIMKYVNMFLTDNLSYDDPFLLHAALYSGPETCIVSRDLMRGHRFLLSDKIMKETFRKWQMSHQYQIDLASRRGDIIVKPPLKYLQSAQKNENSWHVPYIEEYSHHLGASLEASNDWVCLRKN